MPARGTAVCFQTPFSDRSAETGFTQTAELEGNECAVHRLFWFSEQGEEEGGLGFD